jgi:hypothetical protein
MLFQKNKVRFVVKTVSLDLFLCVTFSLTRSFITLDTTSLATLGDRGVSELSLVQQSHSNNQSKKKTIPVKTYPAKAQSGSFIENYNPTSIQTPKNHSER